MAHADVARIDRGLGVVDASLIVVGSIVGGGIFLVSPEVARSVASPAAFLGTWVLGGAVALAGALSNGELGGLFPRSGGEYVYLSETYGPAVGFLSGWTSFWIAFPGSIAALAEGFGGTLASMTGPPGLVAPKAFGVAAVVVLTVVNALGLRPGKWLQNGLSVTKLGAFAVLLGLGFVVPVAGPAGLAGFFGGRDGIGGVATALISVMFAYSGWNAATYVAGEMRDPSRSLGRALGLGTALCAALYLAVNLAYLRAMPLSGLAATTDPARVTAIRLGGVVAARFLSPLVAVSILSSLQATVLVGPRIYQAMAKDGLFFRPFGRAHATTGTPVVSLVAQGAVSIALLLAERFDQLLGYAMFAIVAFSTLTVAAVFVQRWRRPDAPRPFRVPGYPAIPALFIAANLWMLWSVLVHGTQAAVTGCTILAMGVPVYAAFGRHRRSLAPPEPQEYPREKAPR
ncbi:MAG TPA: amino acid permease [Polyangiaceae bacterium]|nr:amino acid permease [Polyangiaceae bacterium]